MCYAEKPGHPVAPLHGVSRLGASEMCGCMDRHGFHGVPHGIHHLGHHERCCCHERRLFCSKERIEILEKYRESLKIELEGVEEALEALRKD